ncbi:ABC transporter permease [Paludibaculum fermentans]|uniref:ABC transporter permease n=1 Tax=Paludibaculum fermentans TaxID=1473598 RepID=A0A7S7NS59_PALFE|nr:ABC transporter permease [Paludibaculum fermentans]QOY88684.1 ABC transporter permease [Paludibaculum fermentans]
MLPKKKQDLDEELRSYFEMSVETKMRAGMTESEATRATRIEMGSMDSVKEAVRDSTWESVFGDLWRDLRHGLRQLRRSPSFTVIAILTLALGLGANTAIFTLIHGVILKQLPVSNPGALYRIGAGENYCCLWLGMQDSWGTFSYPFYRHLADTNKAFSHIAAFSGANPSLGVRRAGSRETAQTLTGEWVSANYFATFGLNASAGRLFIAADDGATAPPAVVMSCRAWKEKYNSDPTLIGSTLVVSGRAMTLVGVAPEGFEGARLTPHPPELWIPLGQEPMFAGSPQNSMLPQRQASWLFLIGRMNPGYPAAAVEAQITNDLRQDLAEYRTSDEDRARLSKQQVRVIPGGTGVSSLRSDSESGLQFLAIAAGLVLLIACANLSNLLLARGVARRQQMALRLSLGATRFRLMRGVLAESLLLSLFGGIGGILVAYAGSGMILWIAFRGDAFIPVSASPSLPVFGFAFALATLAALVFGLFPAWKNTDAGAGEALRSGGRTTSRASSGPQRMLVILQAALSIVLLALTGLLTQSLRNLETTQFGFAAQGRVIANISLDSAGYKQADLPALYPRLEETLRSIPGVRTASYSLQTPQRSCCINLGIQIDGRTEKWISETNVLFNRVSPQYFEAMGVRVLRGRPFSPRDTQAAVHVAIVDEWFAAKFWGSIDEALGKRFGARLDGHARDFEIVGIVNAVKYRNPALVQHPMYFLPFTQSTDYRQEDYRRLEEGTLYPQAIQLNVSGPPERFEMPLRNALASLNPNLLPIEPRSYSEQVAMQFNRERLAARLTVIFSLLSLLLASLGLYGVTAYNVTRRTNEIGVRMALGADRTNVVCMILKGALTNVGIGLLIGIPIAIAAGRALASRLYQIAPFDPLSVGGAVATLLFFAALAGVIPALRAASIAPVTALRNE